MRILYVSHTHPPAGTIMDNVGGMQRVSRQLVDELQTRADVEIQTETIHVYGQGWIALQTVSFLLKLLATLPQKARKFDADIILFSSMPVASLAYFLRSRINIPMVTINHGRDVTLPVRLYQKFVPHVFAALDGVISVSLATKEECVKRGMNPDKGVALPNGFDFSSLDHLPEKDTSRKALQKQFNLPLQNKKMLLTVGRKVKRKGHAWFIREVWPKLNDDVIYVTIGDGPEFDNIEEAMEGSTRKENIFLLGRQPDAVLKQAYAAADLFIMPNIPVEGDMEGFGIVLLEANMARTPAIAADLEGIKDVITPGKNGYKVPVLDADKFAETVNEVLQGDLKHLSDKTRKHVREEFTWNHVAGQYVQFLKDVIDSFHF